MRKDETEASARRGSGTGHPARLLGGFLFLWLASALPVPAQTNLKVFAANFPKIDVLRALANAYGQTRPGVTIEIETGGATLGSQQQALNALLGARDASVDLVLVDVLRVPQWTSGQWLEPLDAPFGPEREAFLARLFPAYRQAALAGGRLMVVPYSADAQAMFVRTDLLEKHGLAVPATQAALHEAATRILAAENQPTLRAIDLSSAPVESSVCTAAMALWGSGHDLVTEGKPALLTDPALRGLRGFQALKDAKLLAIPPGEGHPERVRLAMQAGSLVFGHGWSYAWQRMQTDIDSVVAGKVRVVPVPGETEDRASSCAGGWMVGVTAFSGQKAEALAFLRYLASPEAARLQAELGDLPAQTGPYLDATIVASRPFLGQMGPVLAVARLRPQSTRYSEVSEIVRTNLSAFMAGSKTAEAALQDMQARLSLIFR